MSIWGRKISGRAVAAVAAVIMIGTLLPVMTQAPDREITLVVRGMAFYLDGDFQHPNPTIEVNAGEHVRLVLRNEERGLTHDFALPSLGVKTDLLRWNEGDAVTFEAPSNRGTHEYVCSPHRAMMRGMLRVR